MLTEFESSKGLTSFIISYLQVQSADQHGRDLPHESAGYDQQWPGLVHLCLQPPGRLRGWTPVATVWTLRSCDQRESRQGPTQPKVQGLRIRKHVELRRGPERDPSTQRLPA